ncbi:hypothetical protein ACFTT0_28240 [Streptomyces bauhiniae]
MNRRTYPDYRAAEPLATGEHLPAPPVTSGSARNEEIRAAVAELLSLCG